MAASTVPSSTPVPPVRGVTRTRAARLLLAPLVLVSACGDGPAGPSERPAVPTPAAVEVRFDAIAAVAGQPALSALDHNRLRSGSMARSVGTVVAGALEAALRQSSDREAAGGTVGATMEVDYTVPAVLHGRTYTGFPYWHRDTLPTGEPVPGAPANGVRIKLPALGVFGQMTDPYVADLDIVTTSMEGLTGHTATVRTRAGAVVLEHTMLRGRDGVRLREHASSALADGANRVSGEWTLDFHDVEGGVMRETGAAPFAGIAYAVVMTTSAREVSNQVRLTLDADDFRWVSGDPLAGTFDQGTLTLNGERLGTGNESAMTGLDGRPDAALTTFYAAMASGVHGVPSTYLLTVTTMGMLTWFASDP